ncbi:MAG: hypothetical protein DKM50_03410 [Candidatus Margulisiibacteriota bacterium]|nr:MAG: hypothetical protein A2X43_09550 [Candidatus Margulisbacteria bacterium GWD2_39_127]OGI02866.1 MAG: hypothetical protein A2X42_02215 [Candidatus Margulisbacteria bacterium GWF2_38_17]OGI09647.1 MAG: hypothetical protein A2X41_04925 [Candidatus Margulisbacteria bacterium GWE2_39_32]PZM83027.1 MAG: hypothetical protein DKM50_03410 [Candidatus Margulisiibacteriota bacterium]HAR62187.1 hypothetical protein [Candidatus Margulisiibacteriota bacterium]
MTKIEGLKGLDNQQAGQIKLDSLNDIKDFLKNFSSISEAKAAIGSIIEEIRKVNPQLAQKLDNLLAALDKAEKSGMTLEDFMKTLEKSVGNDAAAAQGMSLIQQSQAVFNDNTSKVDTHALTKTSSIA